MSTPFLGEIRIFGFNFAPRGWHVCDGSLIPIAQYDALFALLGTTFGGDGVSTFGVPDLRSRIPIHQGQGPGLSSYVIGEMTGTEQVTLIAQEMPAHTHAMVASETGSRTKTATGNFLASGEDDIYSNNPGGGTPLLNVVSSTGGNQPHTNIQPILCVNFCIALEGIFPTRN